MTSFSLNDRKLSIAEVFVILGFSLFPLFFDYPYRVNIFLSWEGAYRMYMGHIPYKDFGLPMGFAYWVIPALAFKVFGPYMFSLVKAQVFINILSGFAFRGILKSFDLAGGKRFITVLLYCLTYSFFNFWPWYNHSVFVFELIGIYFLVRGLFSTQKLWMYLFPFIGGAFVFISAFTKQDGGALALLLGLALLLYNAISQKQFIPLLSFLVGFGVTAMALILPFVPHDIGYWFNYGQPPHYSRVSLRDFVDEIFGASMWEKFYLVLVIIIAIIKTNGFQNKKSFFQDQKAFTFFLLTAGILVQALIIQVTSYTPPDNNIYFHSFAFAYLIANVPLTFNFNRLVPIVASLVFIFFWWSGTYYKYVQRIMDRVLPASAADENRNVISKNTFMVSTDSSSMNVEEASWKLSKFKAFSGLYMPESTIQGMERVMEMSEIKGKQNPKVLNMTELTPLAYEIGYELEKPLPLWYHLNVSIFDKEVDEFCNKITGQYYEVVLFEVVPNLNNFYPFKVRDYLKMHYTLSDTFLAPRRPTNATIEVYVRKTHSEELQTP